MHASPLHYPWASPPALDAAIEVAPGVLWLRFALPFVLNHINLWAIDDGEGWALIDTGVGSKTTRAAWEAHFSSTLAAKPVTRVIVTHYHPDHLGNAQWLAERWGVQVEMSITELLIAHLAYAGISSMADFFIRHGLDAERAEAAGGRNRGFKMVTPEIPQSCIRIRHGDTVKLGGTAWQVIGGEGHTYEHLAFYCAERGVLIAGDMLLPTISTNVNVWPLVPEADAVGAFLASIARFNALPADTLVLPSHGLPFRGIQPRVAALTAHHAQRMDALEARMASGPISAADALPVLFNRTLDAHQMFFAMAEAVAHMNHGVDTERFVRERAADRQIRFSLRNPASIKTPPVLDYSEDAVSV